MHVIYSTRRSGLAGVRKVVRGWEWGRLGGRDGRRHRK